MTVAQLSAYLKGVFDDEELLHDITLSGEITDISYSDKHTYLVISEGNFSVRCVRFNARDALQKGQKAALRGTVAYYDRRSQISFVYNEWYVSGIGDKNIKLEALKSKLSGLGYFENRLPLPKYISTVVAVTSPDGAAIRDFIKVVQSKCPFVTVKVYPVKVQGKDAAESIAKAVKNLSNYPCDAVVLCRGGGGDDDLDCFNDETLATAVATSSKPIISAVGHEIDYTLCDFCAGTRAGTPSIAGEIVNAHAMAMVSDLTDSIRSAKDALFNKYELCVERLKSAATRLSIAVNMRLKDHVNQVQRLSVRGYHSLDKKLSACYDSLRGKHSQLSATFKHALDKKYSYVLKLNAVISALNPANLMENGFAVVTLGDKRITKKAQLNNDDRISIRFADGTVTATVEQ